MIEIGSYEAKTKLPELLRIVEMQGEEVFITRNGKKIAKLVPLNDKAEVICAIETIRKFRGKIKFCKSEIKEMITEGRL